ncbi:MAG: hypothetical protein H0X33_09490 [Taibaiella sp.]|nr:hypothetical protein [Taibaiella sp.]
MTNIDDLFRQRLGGGEEKERSGAWSRMKALLDEQEGKKIPGGISWRRMMGYLTGLVILGGVSVGGYEMLNAEHTTSSPGNMAVASNNGSGVAGSAGITHIGSNSSQTPSSSPAVVSSITSVVEKHLANTDNNLAPVHHNKKSSSTLLASNTLVTRTRGSKTITPLNEDKEATKEFTDQNAGTKNTTVNIATNNSTSTSVKNTHNTKDAGNKDMLTNNQAATTVNNREDKNLNKVQSTSSSALSENTYGSGTSSLTPLKPDNSKTGNLVSVKEDNTRNDKKSLANKDSIQQYTVAEHLTYDADNRRHAYEADTVSKGKVPNYLADNTKKTGNLPDNTNMRLANSVSSNNTELVKASPMLNAAKNDNSTAAKDDKTNAWKSAKGHHTNGWDWANISQKIKDFEYNIGTVKVYPGLIGGVNATFFGPVTGGGFHLGGTAEFEISDAFSIIAELKYFQRFTNGVFNDNYNQWTATPDGTGTGNYLHRDTFQHYFNYSNLHSLELPISLRYKIGNFYVFGGVDLIYNFGLTPEEINRQINLVEPATHVPSSFNWQAQYASGPKVSATDFSSIFGLGYLLGLSYEFTPSILVDMRATQMVWDNTKTQGAKQISTTLYQSPSMQLSIIYRLNHKKQILPED